jgi:hypothetical protein
VEKSVADNKATPYSSVLLGSLSLFISSPVQK